MPKLHNPLGFIFADLIIYWGGLEATWKLLAGIFIGRVIFEVELRRRDDTRRKDVDAQAASWIWPWLIEMTIIGLLGRYGNGSESWLPEWIDLAVVALFSLVIFSYAVSLAMTTEQVQEAVRLEEKAIDEAPELQDRLRQPAAERSGDDVATSVVAGMLAGADCIDDLGLLRHGPMHRVFDGIRAPSTLGTYLRSFAHGHVQQLDAVASRFLTGLTSRVRGLLAGRDQPAGIVFIDVDDTIREVHGYTKQGAAFGYSGVRGLNAKPAVPFAPLTAPLIAAARLRRGNGASATGAGRLLSGDQHLPHSRGDRTDAGTRRRPRSRRRSLTPTRTRTLVDPTHPPDQRARPNRVLRRTHHPAPTTVHACFLPGAADRVGELIVTLPRSALDWRSVPGAAPTRLRYQLYRRSDRLRSSRLARRR